MTNLAVLLTVRPELIECIEEIVFMGGGVGIGNRSAVAEYNILCDRTSQNFTSLQLIMSSNSHSLSSAEAAQIVLDAPVKKTMIPLNVSHTAIFTSTIHRRLLSGSSSTQTPQGQGEGGLPLHHPGESLLQSLPPPATPLRNTLSALLLFFAHTYKETFNFIDGPPVHDALTIAYLSRPEIFTVKRYRVDVELAGTHTVGETVVDAWNYRGLGEDSWGPDAKNCLVAESANVSAAN
jgi:uridine nucleosidase